MTKTVVMVTKIVTNGGETCNIVGIKPVVVAEKAVVERLRTMFRSKH